jgi:COP9 signalosome complex subunit 6
MLGRRISLLRTYLDTLPPSYLTDPTIPVKPSPTADQSLLPNHSILRSISATLARINILSPPDTTAFTLESQQEASDVQLIALLSAMTNSIAAAKTFGATSYAVETLKSGGHKPPFPSRHPGSINVLRSDATPFFENGMLGEGLMGNVRDSSDRWH